MVFSSHVFIFYFLAFALAAYYAAPQRWRHPVLTAVSYVFYGWWNPWYVLLMAGGTVIDYQCGRMIAGAADARGRRRGLLISVVSNLAILGFFKYTGFLCDTANGIAHLFGAGGMETPQFIRNIVLPAGISFYIFQSLSYCIDLYRGDARPARSLGDFACFVSLFPQLVAGPIVRYQSIADQLVQRTHSPEIFAAGVARFCLGFSKKILLADPIGGMADMAFHAGPGNLGAVAAWAGVTAYAFQIYFDFSAYSDMAIGLGRMFGFTFLENFDSPYRSASITEFWRRWHISLSTFLRDYLYIPLGGNRCGEARTYLNLITVMLLGGLWHGAQWTFIAWGAAHGIMLAVERWLGKEAPYARLPRAVRVGFTFVLLLFTWVLFRSTDFASAGRHFAAMFGAGGGGNSGLTHSMIFSEGRLLCLAACAAVAFAPWNTQRLLRRLTAWKLGASIALFALSICVLLAAGHSPFLYFQF